MTDKKRKLFDPIFIWESSNKPLDMSEVDYLKQFSGAHDDTAKQPLIDIVNPQPKSFYAKVKKPSLPSQSSQRIKRQRKVGN